jgi:secondary thiamine-phosphate synthase enzyme
MHGVHPDSLGRKNPLPMFSVAIACFISPKDPGSSFPQLIFHRVHRDVKKTAHGAPVDIMWAPMNSPRGKSSVSRHTVPTRRRNELVDVTSIVASAVRDANVQDGLVIVYVPHTTAAVTINENADPDVQHDLLRKLETLIPKSEPYYQHGEGNSDSHVKTSLVGNSVMVLVENARLVLGTWQGIYFCEFDGPRQREMMVKMVTFV